MEYRFVAYTSTELRWVCSLLIELSAYVLQVSMIYCNNVDTTHLNYNTIFHSCMKYIELDYHFIHEQVQSDALCVAHVYSKDQLVDALTKPLPHA